VYSPLKRTKETVFYGVKKISHFFKIGVKPFVSWLGFAPDSNVDFSEEHCDELDPSNNDRMCWMMDDYSGGRAGDNVDLDSDSNWKKVLYYSNHSVDYYSKCGYGSDSVYLNDVGMLRVKAKQASSTFGGVTSFPILITLTLTGVVISVLALLCWKYKPDISTKKACQWLALNKNGSVNQLASEEYQPLLVTTEPQKI